MPPGPNPLSRKPPGYRLACPDITALRSILASPKKLRFSCESCIIALSQALCPVLARLACRQWSRGWSGSRLIGSVSCRIVEIIAFFIGEQIADVADRLPMLILGSSTIFPEEGLEPGEGHFIRIEVGAVGREEQQPRAAVGGSIQGKSEHRRRQSSKECNPVARGYGGRTKDRSSQPDPAKKLPAWKRLDGSPVPVRHLPPRKRSPDPAVAGFFRCFPRLCGRGH